jgi:hypothetical protein
MVVRLVTTETLQEAVVDQRPSPELYAQCHSFKGGGSSPPLPPPLSSTTSASRLIEGRAVYEAQVNFGGARENDLGPGFNFGVPLTSKTPTGADPTNMFR